MEYLPCSWIGRIIIRKIVVLLNTNYRFNAMHIRVTLSFFADIEKSVLKFM
jgi:hypothetical protein